MKLSWTLIFFIDDVCRHLIGTQSDLYSNNDFYEVIYYSL